ncbi:hypothetical protein K490DRAFT_51088 [Saccharata proteae CBS 121410]|uniref:NACHT-NTPase and P-loop NTPases N-terminal domain-containing protein n=1 Tax=Saccharata proteae CBS 121410 TaxID=1314787 RepID=A0A9P4LU27_9PEZI|nr:hypothetical protein K490DRAFT_51088 [Saccharata proteae CBS 121410]
MVLDAFAALGLAANIVQFVDFTHKLISEAKEIHSSVRGVSSRHLVLETIANELRLVTDRLDLKTLSDQCKSIAHSLTEALKSLKSKSTHTPWSSFVQAMREARKSGTIQDIAKKLEKLQGSLMLNLVALIE